MQDLIEFITRRGGWVLLAVAACTMLAISSIVDLRTGEVRLRIDPSANALLADGDDARAFYERIRRQFGSDEMLIVALHDPAGIFSTRRLASIKRISERLDELPEVHHVVSLATALDLISTDDDLVIEPFLDVIPDDESELEALRGRVFANPIYAGTLVSRDAETAALMVVLGEMSDRALIESRLDERVLEIARAESEGGEIWITGGPRVKAETSRVLLRDLRRILPLCFGIMAGIALLSFRSFRGLVLPMLCVAVSLVWTFGIIAATGTSLNLVTIVVPPLILVVGFAYAMHVISSYYEVLRSSLADRPSGSIEAATDALRNVALPTLLTGLTTAAGFLSLAVSPIGAIREFGAFGSLGVVMAMLASITLIPAALALFPLPRRDTEGPSDRFDEVIERVASFDVRHRGAILAAGLLIAALALLAASRIDVSNQLISNFPEDASVRRDFEAINRAFEGTNTFNVVLETDIRDAFKQPANLHQVADLQEWLEAQPEVGITTSIVDYLQLIARAFLDDADAEGIPDSPRLITQLLLFGANDEMESSIDSTYSVANILVRSTAMSSGDVGKLADRIEARLATLPEHMRGRVTGNTILVTRAIDDIARGQALSLLSAFAIIYVILALLFMSFRVGLIALIPNALPVLVYFGILGFSGVTLNTTTGLVACLVLGIAVDDTIHYLSQFNRAARERASVEEGVREALALVGRPITYTTAALCLGFLTLTTAELQSQVQFGALAAATLAFAWVVDVFFTPGLASRLKIVTLWDTLTLDLGEEPQRSIPFFDGLSKTQSRITALMMSIEEYPKDHRIFGIGDPGDCMYVVVEGTLEATLPGESGSVLLASLERGSVIGEVGIFHGERTADIHAVTDVRLIKLDQSDLDRLQRRYPRIGARIMRNLSQVLAERLVRATARVS